MLKNGENKLAPFKLDHNLFADVTNSDIHNNLQDQYDLYETPNHNQIGCNKHFADSPYSTDFYHIVRGQEFNFCLYNKCAILISFVLLTAIIFYTSNSITTKIY